MSSDEAQLPGDWRLGAQDWLATSPWLRRTFPRFSAQRDRLLSDVRIELNTSAPELVRPLLAITGSVLADYPGGHGDGLAPLNQRLAQIRRDRDAASIQLVHFLIATLDAHSRFIDTNPILYGVQATGWKYVPPAYTRVAGDLALTLRQWRDTTMTRGIEEVHVHALRLEPRALEVQISVLAAAVAAHVDAPPTLGWLRDPTASERAPTGARSLAAAPTYYLAVLRVIAPDDPNIIPLYEAYADTCDPTEAAQAEDAAHALTRRNGEGEGDTLLRAALRAWMRKDVDRCVSRAEAAFVAFHASDVDGRILAASLAGLARGERDPLGARAWLTTACTLDTGGDPRFRCYLIMNLAIVSEGLHGSVTPTRDHDRLTSANVANSAVSEAIPRPEAPEAVVSATHEDFDVSEARALLTAEEPDAEGAYRCFSEQMGALLERHPRHDAIMILAACHVAFEEEILRAGAYDGTIRRSVAATLTSWTCAALSELHDLAGNTAEWARYTARQLDLEDHDLAAPEISADEIAAWFQDYYDLDYRTRISECIARAQTALAAGASEKARFWHERAQDYRTRTRRI